MNGDGALGAKPIAANKTPAYKAAFAGVVNTIRWLKLAKIGYARVLFSNA